MIQLIKLREAIELFSVLSVVNNKAFKERFHFTWKAQCYPRWDLRVTGAASIPWSRLFGLLGSSSHFQLAIQKVKAMLPEESDKDSDTLNGFETGVQRWFNVGVPMLVQLGFTWDCATPVSIRQRRLADAQPVPMDVNISVTIRALTAIYSRALAQLVTPITFEIDAVDSALWPLLVYAVCCEPSVETSLEISDAALTKSDLLSIADVLKYDYPLSTTSGLGLRSRIHDASEFGFVDILEGTEVWPIDFESREHVTTRVVSNSQHFRAWFKEHFHVEILVPGFGLGRTKIGNGVSEVSRDSEEQNVQAASSICSLSVHFSSVESVCLVVNLVELIGRNLRSLDMSAGIHDTLDLSVLSAVCPNLRFQEIYDFDVAVSVREPASVANRGVEYQQ